MIGIIFQVEVVSCRRMERGEEPQVATRLQEQARCVFWSVAAVPDVDMAGDGLMVRFGLWVWCWVWVAGCRVVCCLASCRSASRKRLKVSAARPHEND
jgi:hypothetical protein